MRLTRRALNEILSTVGAQAPETGGALLGSGDDDVIDTFIYDKKGSGHRMGLRPDADYLNCMINRAGPNYTMRGFLHSHPRGYPEPSELDMAWVKGTFDANPRLNEFWMPILIEPPCDKIIPGENLLCYLFCRNGRWRRANVCLM